MRARLNPTVVVLKLLLRLLFLLWTIWSQSNRSGFETRHHLVREGEPPRLNPTVVVLKPVQPQLVGRQIGGLNPTVVVLKLCRSRTGASRPCVSIQP